VQLSATCSEPTLQKNAPTISATQAASEAKPIML
jgi:hypothetical protein